MKKIYFLFLMALLPLVASAETVIINGIKYDVNPKAKTATVISNSYSGKIVIPKTVSFKNIKCKVTSIGSYAFKGRDGLTSITIPSTVTSIGYYAFYGCTNLTSVAIPNSVTSIDSYAFYGCSGLKSANIPNSVISIDSYAFCKCSGLTSVTIGNSVTSIGSCAFYDCDGLKSATIGNSVTTIESHAFCGCSSLKSATIGNSVTSIGYCAFYGCSSLTSVIIPNSVSFIGSEAFSNCSSLTSINILSSVTSIGNAFDETPWYKNKPDGVVYAGKVLYKYKGTMTSGTKISVKNGTLGIANYAFYGCSGLTSVTIPNSVISIGDYAFKSCSNLKTANIGNSVTTIGYYAFYGCSGLKSANIPNSVTSIGSYAFYGCSSLTSVIIPNSVFSIGSRAFYDCDGLKSATIGNSVARIEDYAFYGCNSLATVMIGNGINYIGDHSFATCQQLTDFYCFAENVPNCFFSPFYNSYINYVTLHVPASRVDAYKGTSPWSNFGSKVAIETVKVKLNKTKVTLDKGETVTLKATITPSTFPDKNVTWKSSNKKIATVTSAGKVKALKTGTATITCTSEITGEKATCKITVFEGSVTLDKTEVTLQKGKTVTLTPTVLPTTLEDKSVTWTSSDKKVATVTSSGKVKGIKAGTATITCTSNATGMSTTCQVTVVNGTVTLNKTEAYLEKGKTTTLKATLTPTTLEDKSVTWTSSDKSIATVSSTGKVKGVKYGTATITCTSNATGLSATCQVTVGKVVISMSEFSLRKSRTTVLTASVYPSTLTDKSVTWESSNTKVATVTSDGKVKGIAAGTATITCTSAATGLKSTCTVTVLATTESRSTEGDDDNVTGIENLEEAPVATEPFDVYDLSGRKVRHQVTSLDGLPDGIYIVNGRKILKK